MTSDSDALDELFWRSEILQAMYWMQGEGIAAEVETAGLASFLSAEPAVVRHQLVRLVADGYLEADNADSSAGLYRLTDLGRQEGGRSFQDEFAELTRPAHGECAADCSCHDPRSAGQPCPSGRSYAP
jgi:DNA-binding PadR family transcriptional regulator